MLDNAYQNQFRALRSRKSTSRVVPLVGGGETERDRRRDCDLERVNDHVRDFDTDGLPERTLLMGFDAAGDSMR